MLEIFQYSFMIRAFIAGILVGIIAPIVGTFLVSRRYSLIADSLSHVALSGVAIGLITKTYPVYAALAVTVSAAIAIEKLRVSKRISGESALAIFLSGGLALSVVLIGLAGGFNVDLFSYLFGSITTVRSQDLWIILALGIIVIGLLYSLYKELFYISFDEEAARVSGVPTDFLNTLLVILTAVTIVLSMRIVGVLLIGALMVIPTITAAQIAKSFKQVIFISLILSLTAVISGLFFAYYLNVPAGGSIVVIALTFFLFAMIISSQTVRAFFK